MQIFSANASAERAAEDGEVLREDEDLAADDRAVAGDDAVAGGPRSIIPKCGLRWRTKRSSSTKLPGSSRCSSALAGEQLAALSLPLDGRSDRPSGAPPRAARALRASLRRCASGCESSARSSLSGRARPRGEARSVSARSAHRRRRLLRRGVGVRRSPHGASYVPNSSRRASQISPTRAARGQGVTHRGSRFAVAARGLATRASAAVGRGGVALGPQRRVRSIWRALALGIEVVERDLASSVVALEALTPTIDALAGLDLPLRRRRPSRRSRPGRSPPRSPRRRRRARRSARSAPAPARSSSSVSASTK